MEKAMVTTKRMQTLIKSQNNLNKTIFNISQEINEKKLIELATNVFNVVKSKLMFKIKKCNNKYCPYYHIAANNHFYYKSVFPWELLWEKYIIKRIEHEGAFDGTTDRIVIEKVFPSDICINFNHIREKSENLYSVDPVKSIEIQITFRKYESNIKNNKPRNSIDFEISIIISKKKRYEYAIYFDISNQRLNVYANPKHHLNEELIISIIKKTFEELLKIPDKIFHQKPVYAKINLKDEK
jgi:hypothetical protein